MARKKKFSSIGEKRKLDLSVIYVLWNFGHIELDSDVGNNYEI